jgi:hypothetical protein
VCARRLIPGLLCSADDVTVGVAGAGCSATRAGLATLDGHLEAGEIEFRASSVGGALRIEIESWPGPGTAWLTCFTTSCGWPRRSS